MSSSALRDRASAHARYATRLAVGAEYERLIASTPSGRARRRRVIAGGSREADSRCTSPSSHNVTSDVSSPIP
jgi:hypothetical protein